MAWRGGVQGLVDRADSLLHVVGPPESVPRARLRVSVIVLCVISGLLVGRALMDRGQMPASWTLLGAGTILGLLGVLCVAAGRRWLARSLLPACVVVLSCGYFCARLGESRSDRLDLLLTGHGVDANQAMLVTVRGVMLETPRPPTRGGGPLDSFLVRDDGDRADVAIRGVMRMSEAGEVRWSQASGQLRMILQRGRTDARAGEMIQVTGLFTPARPPRNPGDERSILWQRQRNDAGVLKASDASLVLRDHGPRTWIDVAQGPILRARALLQERARDVLRRAGGTSLANQRLVLALILGEREFDRTEEGAAFGRLGLAHVLSISGFHLTILATSALWLLRLAGRQGPLEPLLLAGLMGVYLLMVPLESPIVRSAILALALLTARALGRRYDPVCVLGWACVLLLLWRPADLWSMGFQLSMGLTAMLLWAGEAVTRGLWGTPVRGLIVPERGPGGRALEGLRTLLACNLMCWGVSLPVVAGGAGLVSVLGVIASMLISPIFVLVLWVGYVALFAGLAIPPLAGAAGSVLGLLCDAALWLVGWLDGLEWSSIRVPPVPVWWVVLATTVGVLWCRCAAGTPRRWRLAWIALAAVAVGAIAPAWMGRGIPHDSRLRVDMLDVGDGTSMLLRSGGDALLWDAKQMGGGGPMPGGVRALRSLGAWPVARVIITHPDIDHYGGLPELLEPMGVREVLVPPRMLDQARQEPYGPVSTLMALLDARAVRVRALHAGDVLRLGEATLTFLNPAQGANWEDDNDHSLVALVEAPRAGTDSPVRVLLTGDVGPRAIGALREVVRPPLDAMEAPHHGSARGEAIAWVRALRPGIVLQSTGPRRLNDVRWRDESLAPGPPDQATWLITARTGWASVSWDDAGGVRVGTMRPEPHATSLTAPPVPTGPGAAP